MRREKCSLVFDSPVEAASQSIVTVQRWLTFDRVVRSRMLARRARHGGEIGHEDEFHRHLRELPAGNLFVTRDVLAEQQLHPAVVARPERATDEFRALTGRM